MFARFETAGQPSCPISAPALIAGRMPVEAAGEPVDLVSTWNAWASSAGGLRNDTGSSLGITGALLQVLLVL